MFPHVPRTMSVSFVYVWFSFHHVTQHVEKDIKKMNFKPVVPFCATSGPLPYFFMKVPRCSANELQFFVDRKLTHGPTLNLKECEKGRARGEGESLRHV